MKFKKYIRESLSDMNRRCEKCNTLLNDGGTCPKCDDGEEEIIEEALSNREKLKRAYPELNFDVPTSVTEDVMKEDLSAVEKLKRAYPELNFDRKDELVTESATCEELSVRQKLKNAYPELNFGDVTESYDEYEDSDDWYDDDYEMDDVEMDRAHAALYGGDRMYCDCGRRLVMDEWGGYCPECNPQDPMSVYDDIDEDPDYTEVLHESKTLSRKSMVDAITDDGTRTLLFPKHAELNKILNKYDVTIDTVDSLDDKKLAALYKSIRRLVLTTLKLLSRDDKVNPEFFDAWGLGKDIAKNFGAERRVAKITNKK